MTREENADVLLLVLCLALNQGEIAMLDQMFAISTEFIENAFNCKDAASGERKQFSVKNNNALNSAFRATGLDEAYLAIQPTLKNAAVLRLLTNCFLPMMRSSSLMMGPFHA